MDTTKATSLAPIRRIASDALIGSVVLMAFNINSANIALGLIASLCLAFVAIQEENDASVTRNALIAALYFAGLIFYMSGIRIAPLTDLLPNMFGLQFAMPALPGP